MRLSPQVHNHTEGPHQLLLALQAPIQHLGHDAWGKHVDYGVDGGLAECLILHPGVLVSQVYQPFERQFCLQAPLNLPLKALGSVGVPWELAELPQLCRQQPGWVRLPQAPFLLYQAVNSGHPVHTV